MACPTKLDSFADVAAVWDSLLAQCLSPSVFLTQQWQRTWWEVFGQEKVLHLAPICADGATVGLAPLQYDDYTLGFLGDMDLFDYHDFLYPAGAGDIFFPALVDHLGAEPWHTLDLRSLPGDSLTLEHLPKLLRQRGYQVTLEQEDVTPRVPLARSWEEYLSGLRKKDRHELRRKFRRLETSGSVQYVQVSPEDFPHAVDDFLMLMRMSDERKCQFLTPQREMFFRRLSDITGASRLFFLELDGERVASVLCFDYAGTRYLYNSGYDRSYNHLSVGLLLKALCLKDAIEQGLSNFDFLRGDERYKYCLGAQDIGLYHLSAHGLENS